MDSEWERMDEKDDRHDERFARRQKKLLTRGPGTRLLPFAIRHGLTFAGTEAGEEAWLRPQERATQWVDLLYDLVIVAILTVFSQAHEVASANSILIYFSYFVIIWWVWASQVLYDVRFQANDWLHRLFKFVQLGAFAIVGVTAQNFDPFNVVSPVDASTNDAVKQAAGADAFQGVAAAYATTRLVLMLQYLYVVWTLRKQNRHLKSLLIPAGTSALSAILWYCSGYTGNSAAKLALGYSGLGIEYASALLLSLSPKYMRTPAAEVSERYSALTLIIIGEGIIGVVPAFSAVLAGFGFSRSAYVQCFCALVIVSASWHFLFNGFSTQIRMGRQRGVLWLILHLPLHLVILLLLTGMRNAATYGNIGYAVDVVETNLNILLNDLISGNFTTSQIPMDYLTIQFAKLQLQPSWPEEVRNLESEFLDPNNTVDPFVDLIQYETQILLGIVEFYQVKLSDDVFQLSNEIYSLNSTWNPADPHRDETYAGYYHLLEEFQTAYATDIGHGVLFFLPCAGGLLFLACILVVLRTPPLGAWMWIAWGVQMAGAVGLCFLGFLDLGNQTLDVNAEHQIPVYRLLNANWMLPTAALTYGVLIVVDCIMMAIALHSEGRRSQSPVALTSPAPVNVPVTVPATIDPPPEEDSSSKQARESQHSARTSLSHLPQQEQHRLSAV